MMEVYWSGAKERAGTCPHLTTYIGGSTLGPIQPEPLTTEEVERRERIARQKRNLRLMQNPIMLAKKRAYDKARYDRHKAAIEAKR